MRQGDTIDGRFVIEELAGSGGMARVYRARDLARGAIVAVKTLRRGEPSDAARLAREAEVLSSLKHPRIVRYVAHGRLDDGSPYLATEWLEGEDLARRLARGALRYTETIALGIAVAEALGTAHDSGVVHRDIKPSNLFLVNGRIDAVKILDFGVARLGAGRSAGEAEPGASSVPLTDTGAMIGTPGYISPEQARGEPLVDARADVFSLGCVLYQCVTGRRPFEGEEVLAVLLKLVLEEAPRPRELRADVPEALDALLTRMLSKAPAHRPADGWAVALALADVDAPLSVRPHAQSPPSPPSLTGAERRVMCAVLARLPERGRGAAGAPVERAALEAAIAPHDGRLDILADGSLLVRAPKAGAFTDEVARAARSALAVRKALPGAAVAVVAGRVEVQGRLPVGEVIERGVSMLRRRSAEAPEVQIDDVVAGLLAASFDVRGEGSDLHLVAEREAEAPRTLLGRPTPCVGRELEIATLLSLFEQVSAEPVARVVRVIGEAGVGKSRLVHELCARLRAQDAAFEQWVGRGDPVHGGAPFGVLAPALRRAAGILDGEPLPVRRKKLRARVGRHVARDDLDRVADFLGELVGAPSPDEDSVLLRAARRDPVLMGDQMRCAFEDLVAAECAAQPLVLLLEDLAWGDLPSLQFIDSALRNLPDRPLLVVAAARPEIYERFPGLWAARPTTDLKLGGLTRRASERLVRETLGDAVDTATVERIVGQAGGNAFYLEELIRAVAGGKGAALPDTVLGMVQARLDELSPEARRVLRAASIFGQVFWDGGVLALTGGGASRGGAEAVSSDAPLDLRAALDELVERELVQRRPGARFPGQQELVFRQASVLMAAHATLTEADRALGHGLAGAWLEAAGESDACVLAEHFERGGERARAAAAYRRAAEQAFSGNDLDAAIRWADRGVACAGEIGALRLIQAEAHHFRGEIALAEEGALEAMAALPPDTPAWYAAIGEAANAAGRLGHNDRLASLGDVLRARWSATAGSAQIAATARAATVLLAAGDYARADALIAGLRAIADRLDDPSVRGRVLHTLGTRALIAGDASAHLEGMIACAASHERAGDLRSVALARGNVGYAYLTLGAYAPAEAALRASLAIASRLNLPTLVAHAQHNLGFVLARLGDLPQGLRIEREGVHGFAACGDVRLAGGARSYLAILLQEQGALEEAQREAEDAAFTLESAPPIRVFALAVLARILLSRGRVDESLRVAREAFDILATLGAVEEGGALVRLVYAEALHASGAIAEARAAIADAEARLLADAAKIRDPALRETFLTRIPENARTLKLKRDWLDDDRA